MAKQKSSIHPTVANSHENQIRLREYLMTSFFLMVVYDLLTKPIANSIISWLDSQISNNSYPSFFGKWFDYNNIFLSTLPNANINMFITITALIFTGIYCWFIFKLSSWFLYIPWVKGYLEDHRRKSFYSSSTGAIILLSFLMTAFLIMLLYPVLGVAIITFIILAKNWEDNEAKG